MTRFRRWLAALAPRLIKAALFGVPLIALAVFFAWEVPRISTITAGQTDALPIFWGCALATGNDPYALSIGSQAFRLATGTSRGIVCASLSYPDRHLCQGTLRAPRCACARWQEERRAPSSRCYYTHGRALLGRSDADLPGKKLSSLIEAE